MVTYSTERDHSVMLYYPILVMAGWDKFSNDSMKESTLHHSLKESTLHHSMKDSVIPDTSGTMSFSEFGSIYLSRQSPTLNKRIDPLDIPYGQSSTINEHRSSRNSNHVSGFRYHYFQVFIVNQTSIKLYHEAFICENVLFVSPILKKLFIQSIVQSHF